MNSKVIKNQSEIQPSLTLCHKLYCESETGEKRLMFAADAGNKQKNGSCPTYWCVKQPAYILRCEFQPTFHVSVTYS